MVRLTLTWNLCWQERVACMSCQLTPSLNLAATHQSAFCYLVSWEPGWLSVPVCKVKTDVELASKEKKANQRRILRTQKYCGSNGKILPTDYFVCFLLLSLFCSLEWQRAPQPYRHFTPG